MDLEKNWEEIHRLRTRWLDVQSPDDSDWPARGIAIEGDFAGIQNFVLKPVPGARGAAKRLRGRSLQVSALTELFAREVELAAPGAKMFYAAGGRFLASAPDSPAIPGLLAGLQRRIDEWIGCEFRGEVTFHLVCAPFSDGRIPRVRLREEMTRRKSRALEGFLLTPDGQWDEGRFLRAAGGEPGDEPFDCPACRTTANKKHPQADEQGADICGECDRDKRLGKRLAHTGRAGIARDADGEIPFLDGARYTISDSGSLTAHVIHHMPKEGGNPLTLEEIAAKSAGSRKWLAFLRLDGDKVGQEFEKLHDSPARVRALSGLLQKFYCDRVQLLLTSGRPEHRDYKWIYPVYGGGDDLFVIGPWNIVIDFAAELATEFHKATQGKLSFSAGVALSKPRQHILAMSDEADAGLNDFAKKAEGKRSIRVFGETFSWVEFERVMRTARKVSNWYNDGLIPSRLLHILIALHEESRRAPAGTAIAARYRPLLHYQTHRNLNRREQQGVLGWFDRIVGQEDGRASRSSGDGEGDAGRWSEIGFAARYAMLAAAKDLSEDNE